jgi:N-acetyl-anhydromuramyl-L-alanine amidase AmpD
MSERRRRTDYIVVHCSATRAASDIGADEIRQWHVKDNGWSDIGYHAVIRRDGDIELGRHFDVAGAHVQGQNMRSVGVCLVGGLAADANTAENNFTDEQFAALKKVVAFLTDLYPTAEVLGHRDLSPDLDGDGVVEKEEWVKECPSFDARAWWKAQEVT